MTIVSRQDCLAMDATDPLAAKRAAFDLPERMIYLDGNSLGAMPQTVAERLTGVVSEEWGRGLIKSWNEAGWVDLPGRVGARIAALIGAEADEVVAADSTSVNLYKAVMTAVKLRPGRHRIITEAGNFPTDLYILQGITDLLPELELVTLPRQEIAAAIDDDTAAVVLTHVHYVSGEMFDMAAMTAAAHKAGALAVWDLSHSTGAVPVDLKAAAADFAVGCGYKYLNGGPGAPAFVYAARRHHGAADQPLTGWFGHRRPFDFKDEYEAAPGIGQFLCGTPGVLAMSALEESLKLFDDVSMKQIRAKSVAMTELFTALVEHECADLGLMLVSPREAAKRGSQVSFRHEDGYAVMKALIDRGVIGDFRAPDHIRFGFTPLYLRFVDVWDAVQLLKDVLVSGDYKKPEHRVRDAVT